MEFDIEGDYGQGWEVVTAEVTPETAIEQLDTYNANEPNIPHRIRPLDAASRKALSEYRAKEVG